MATKTNKSEENGKGTATAKPKAKAKAAPDLVIVESPAKARTINKYLGAGYVVKASMGHVRDLPERGFGIDLTDGFTPTYRLLPSRKKVLNELRKAADKATTVYLATDLDREGEAIAWHLVAALELPPGKARRVIFNEITKSAVTAAFADAHEVDLSKVNAQQARRILDRIVGYELSPLLWQKIAKGLSAGRVQSVAVRIIVEREVAIRAFVPTESWQITTCLATNPDQQAKLIAAWETFTNRPGKGEDLTQKQRLAWLGKHDAIWAELVRFDDQPFRPTGHEEARRVVEALGFACTEVKSAPWEEYAKHNLATVSLIGGFDPAKAPAFAVSDVTTKRTRSKPPGPFTTATLQQASSTQLRFGTAKTMRVAQQLYEGIDVGGGEGPVGLITYMRTDSRNLSTESVTAVRNHIKEVYGDVYLPPKPLTYSAKKGAQEAHEAVRPTEPTRTPAAIKGQVTADQLKLYDLIWKRFVACQMLPAEWDSTTVLFTADTSAGRAEFKAAGRRLVFDGYLKVAGVPDAADEQHLPELTESQPVAPISLMPRQVFTSPPARYSEASLVKSLEAEGIGRPSTYAAIIETVQKRGYVEQVERRFFATPMGERVTEKLVAHFPKIMDVKFTAYMESELDKIEESHKDWVEVLHEFYDPFHESLLRAKEEMEAERAEPSEFTCDECGKPMVYRWSKSGRFLACTGYPDCKTSYDADRDGKPVKPVIADEKCEKCGKPMVLRRSRHGPFLGCTGYPECRGTLECDDTGQALKLVKEEDIKETCDSCNSPMQVRWRGARAFLGCSAYPKCKETKPFPEGIRLERPPQETPEEAGLNCEKCGKPMVIRSGRRGKFIACTGYPRCRTTKPVEKLEELKAQAAENKKNAPAKPEGEGEGETPKDADAKKLTGDGSASPMDSRFSTTKSGKLVVDSIEEPLDCPTCGRTMVVKSGRWGPFLSCEDYPRCKTAARLKGQALIQAKEEVGEPEKREKPIPTDVECEQCGTKMVIRTGRSGQFLGCGGYPKCRNTQPVPPELIRATAAGT